MSRLPGKRAWPVLRGLRRGNAPELPDEIYFSVVQHKVLSPNDFTDLAEVEGRLTGFEKRYNQTARPFRWSFTRDDLHDLLERISQPEQQEAGDQFPAAA